jgi:hypothetical protein
MQFNPGFSSNSAVDSARHQLPHRNLYRSPIYVEVMSASFSVKGLFKSRKSKKAETQEAQNGGHPPDGPTAPPIISKTLERDAASITPTLSQPQNPSVATSSDGNTSEIPSSCVQQARVPPDVQVGPAGADTQKEARPGTEFAAQQTQVISTSQRLWNDAYDGLENDETAKLVKAYVKTLTMVLEAENASDTSDSRANDVPTELNDLTKRQRSQLGNDAFIQLQQTSRK